MWMCVIGSHCMLERMEQRVKEWVWSQDIQWCAGVIGALHDSEGAGNGVKGCGLAIGMLISLMTFCCICIWQLA